MKTSLQVVVALLGALSISDPGMAQRRGGQGPRAQQQCEQQQGCLQKVEGKIALAEAAVIQLQGTLADEFLARDFYRAAGKQFGGRQFANHARAEQNHIAALTNVLKAAGVDPVTEASRAVEIPKTLEQAHELAAQLENEMIAAYDRLLEQVENEKIRPMLERIQVANRRHLASAQGEGKGPGQGKGRGQGKGQRGQGNGRGQGKGQRGQGNGRGQGKGQRGQGNGRGQGGGRGQGKGQSRRGQRVDSSRRCASGSASCRR